MGWLDFKIGFLPISIWDVLDVVIVAFLLFQLYKLLRGSIAFNIFFGVLLLYVAWWLVTQLGMKLLSGILNQFVNVGVIVLIIIFQPEVRRFLLFLGNSTLRHRSEFWDRILYSGGAASVSHKAHIDAVLAALLRLARSRTGALVVLSRNLNLDGFISGGTLLDAQISSALLESIFHKESPLHDGAVIIHNDKLLQAGCVLPVSESANLPRSAGLRHRAAVGITERTSVATFVVSEESGAISMAFQGQLEYKLSEQRLRELLEQYSVG